jgi:signal peptide peptidase SppA
MRYPRIRSALAEAIWAMHPTYLGVLLEIVEVRLEGHVFSREELDERVGGLRAELEARRQRANELSGGGAIAVLPLYGGIFPRANLVTEWSGGTSLEQWGATLDALANDPNVAAIILDVDSPGGSADLVPETAAKVRRAAERKQLVAVADTMAASAAYWIASQAPELVVTPSGSVGSIGVRAAHTDISGHEEQEGLRTTLVTAGRYKGEFSPWGPLSEEARAELQRLVDVVYDKFTADVARGRGVTKQTAQGPDFGQGRMLEAERAVARGLADRVATLDETIEQVRTDASNGSRRSSSRAESERFAQNGQPRIEIAVAGDSSVDSAALTEHVLRALESGRLQAADDAAALAEIADSLRQATADVKGLDQ